MSEEYLAQQNSQLYWFAGIVIFFVVAFLISYFATRKLDESRKIFIRKKVFLVYICVLVGYFFLTIPYAGFSYNFGSAKNFPKELNSNEQVADYIKDHHHRIEDLERELKETTEDLRLLNDHYKNLLYIIMMAVFSYSGSQIFSSQKKKDLREIESNQLTKL